MPRTAVALVTISVSTKVPSAFSSQTAICGPRSRRLLALGVSQGDCSSLRRHSGWKAKRRIRARPAGWADEGRSATNEREADSATAPATTAAREDMCPAIVDERGEG